MKRNTAIATGTAGGFILLFLLAAILAVALSSNAQTNGESLSAGQVPLLLEGTSCEFADWIGIRRAELDSRVAGMARPYRILPPGSVMTMDYSPSRVNFELDGNGIVTRVFCG